MVSMILRITVLVTMRIVIVIVTVRIVIVKVTVRITFKYSKLSCGPDGRTVAILRHTLILAGFLSPHHWLNSQEGTSLKV